MQFKKINDHPIFDLPFRSFFISAVGISVISLLIWIAFLHGQISLFNQGLNATVWHIHEMLFGFGATVAVGFLLTAVQTWTNKPSIKGSPVIALLSLWLLVRIFLLVNQPLFIYMAIALQLTWWLIVITVFSRLVISAKNSRNYVFIPLLTTLMILNVGVLILDTLGHTDIALHFARTAVLMFGLLMAILGGRVIPFFTSAATHVKATTSPSWVTPLLLVTSISGISVFFVGQFISLPFTPAALMICAGILHILRLSFWHSKATLSQPLLWSLHLSYLSLAIGLLLLGSSYLHTFILFSDALHMITIGAMGLMIIAMMSRVSLGHTGRRLQPSKWVALSFALLFSAAIARVFLPMLGHIQLAWDLSALAWMLAGCIFLVIYAPILAKARK